MEDMAVANLDTIVASNSSSNVGGSLCMYGTSKVSVTNSMFTDARALVGGGGCMSVEEDSVLRLVGSTLSGCSTAKWGGGINTLDQAEVEVVNSTIAKTTAVRGGALAAQGNATLRVVDSRVSGGRATKEAGGCMHVNGNCEVNLLRTVVAGCSTPAAGGGVAVEQKAALKLVNCTIRNNTAGKVEGGTIATNLYVHGGGVAVFDEASLTVEGSEIMGNYAQFAGGGLYLEDDTKTSFQGTTPTRIYNNEAKTVAGGIRLATTLSEQDLSRFVVENNTAPNSPDVGIVAASIEVLSSNGDELLASDNRDGFLQVTINVSGANEMPSSDDLTYTVYNTSTAALFTQTVSTGNGHLKELAISLKLPPGVMHVYAIYELR